MNCSRSASALLVIGILAIGPGPLRAEPRAPDGAADARVFVPSFWDPGATPEKPKLDDLASIRFVTEDDYPPFGFTLPDGTLAGFNVDLARAICEGTRRRLHDPGPPLRHDRAGPQGAGRRCGDRLHGHHRPGTGRRRFHRALLQDAGRFVARAGSTLESVRPETLGQRSVAVARGTAHEAFLKAAFPKLRIVSLGTAAEVQAAVLSGAADLGFGDGIGLAQWLAGPEAHGCCAFVGGAFTESRYFGEGAGIAVRKGDDTLRTALDYGLARVAAKGTYADLYLKYFPIGIY